jgi:hypothetical protein
MFADHDIVHLKVIGDHRFRRSALIALQREGGCLGQAAETYRLDDDAFAAHPGDFVRRVAVE